MIFTDDETYPGGGQRHRPRNRGGRGRPEPRLRRAERVGLAGAGIEVRADAPRRLDGRRPHVVAPRHVRLRAGLRAALGRRRADGPRPRRDGCLRRRRGDACSTSRRRSGARFTSGTLGRDPRSGVVFAYATLPLAGGRRARSRAACRPPTTAGRRGARPTARSLEAVREAGAGEEWGPAKGSKPSVGPIAVSAHFPLEAYVGLRGLVLPGRGEKPWNGIAKTTDGGKTWSVVHAESDQPSPNLAGVVDRAARGRGRPLGLVRLALRPRGGAERPGGRLRDRPLPHVPHGGRREDVGAGELGGPRRGPLDDARARRHHDLRHPVRSARPAARLHPLHGHRPLPQRRRRRDVDGLDERHPDALAQHDLLARVRPRGEGPRVGRVQRHARPAAAEDVAPHRPRAVPGRGRGLDGRRAALDAVERRHGGVGDHPRAPRPEEPEGRAHALRHRVRPRRLQVGGRREDVGRCATTASPPTRGTSRSRGA